MPHLSDYGPYPRLLLIAALIVVALTVIRRIPYLRTVVNVSLTFGLVALLIVTVVQRQKVDPWLGQAAGFLNLDEQTVSGGTTRIRMAPDGHFWAHVRLDGVERRMLIDSGATITAVSTATAAEAGLKPSDGMFPIVLRTANGAVRAQSAEVGELHLGDIAAHDLAVVVSPAFGDTDVIGMNFLSRLKSWRVEGNWLILEPHHPQDSEPVPQRSAR